MLSWSSKIEFYPLWDIKDRSIKFKTLKSIDTTQ